MTNSDNSPAQIAIGIDGLTVIPQADVKGGELTDQSTKLAKLEQPPAFDPEPPTYANQTKDIRALTTKAVLCAMEKLNVLLSSVQPTAEQLTQYMELTLKLLDAKEAFEWADAFRAAILRNPKLLSPNGKGLAGKSLQTRTNATIAQRLDRGDTRTTPKRLMASMPGVDSEEDSKATG